MGGCKDKAKFDDWAKSIAAYEGGVLTLTLPKAPGGTSTKLAVH